MFFAFFFTPYWVALEDLGTFSSRDLGSWEELKALTWQPSVD
jgi:hypothetical protein